MLNVTSAKVIACIAMAIVTAATLINDGLAQEQKKETHPAYRYGGSSGDTKAYRDTSGRWVLSDLDTLPACDSVVVETDPPEGYSPLIGLFGPRGAVAIRWRDGTFTTVARNAVGQYPVAHSGLERRICSTADRVWIAWASASDDALGTPCWIAEVNRKTRELIRLSPAKGKDHLSLGGAGLNLSWNQHIGSDDHNLPQVAVLPDGRLFALLSAHHGPMYWTTSDRVGTLELGEGTSGFWPMRLVDPRTTRTGMGWTYPSFVIEGDTVHIVARLTGFDGGYGDNFRLAHTTLNWRTGKQGTITTIDTAPKPHNYGIWYHHLSLEGEALVLDTHPHHRVTGTNEVVETRGAEVWRSEDQGLSWEPDQ